MRLFHKKKKDEISLELKKYPKKRRAKLRELYLQYQAGKGLKIYKEENSSL